jgi:hypothetical protein
MALAAAVSIVGAALLIWQLQRTGLDEIKQGLWQVGWGFLGILALSLVRFALRAVAWTTLMDHRRGVATAIGATLAGDAIGNLTPLSLLVSEPAKSMYLRDEVPGSRSFPALAAENFFYSVSVAVYIILGTIAMLQEFSVPPELRLAGILSIVAMSLVLGGALWIGWREPALFSGVMERIPIRAVANLLDRVRRFESSTYGFLRRNERPLGVVLACETAFHVASFAEAALTIWLITTEWHLLAAFVFDAVNRVINVVFRPIPLRIGVDEVSAGILAPALGLNPAVGVTLALVRKGRMLAWAAIGITLAIRKGLKLRDVVDSGR